MSFSQTVGLNVVPIFLRVALGVVFLWAGTSKLWYTMPVSGEDAASLARLGIISAEARERAADEAEADGEEVRRGTAEARILPARLLQENAADEQEAGQEAGEGQQREEDAAGADAGDIEPDPGSDAATAEAQSFTAADFPDPIRVPRWAGLVLTLEQAASQKGTGRRLLPAALETNGTLLEILARAAAIVEFFGGVFVLVGLFTRIWALGFCGVMLMAMWLTQVGPAIGSPNAFLGFLPATEMSDHAQWTKAWSTLMLQLTTLACAGSLLFLGAGRLSLDALLFRRGPKRTAGDEDEDGD